MGAPENLKKAVDGFGARVEAIRDDQWHNSTPCTEWDVHALVNHVLGEVRWIAPLVAGKTIADVGDTLNGDLLGEDPKAAWRQGAAETLTAVQQPGAMEGVSHLSYGDRPSPEYVDEVAVDVMIHTWDLARGIGADERLDADLVQLALPQFSSEGMEAARAGGYFGEAVEVPADADPQTRLLGLSGRQVGAPATAG